MIFSCSCSKHEIMGSKPSIVFSFPSFHAFLFVCFSCFSLEMKRSRDHVPWRMAERVRSRHSNTNIATPDTDPYTRARQKQHAKSAFSVKESSGFKKSAIKEPLSEIEEDEDGVEIEMRPSQSKSKQNHSSERKRSVQSYLRTIQRLSAELDGFRVQLGETIFNFSRTTLLLFDYSSRWDRNILLANMLPIYLILPVDNTRIIILLANLS